jgi:hypothetical protein
MGFDKNSWLSETSSNSKISILRLYWRPRALHLFTQRLLFILTVLAKSVDEAPSHLVKSCRCDIFFRYDALLSAQMVAALDRVVPHLSRRFITPYKESAWFVVAYQVVLQVTSVDWSLQSPLCGLSRSYCRVRRQGPRTAESSPRPFTCTVSFRPRVSSVSRTQRRLTS